MIYFCGDTHGDIDIGKVLFLAKKVKPTRDDVLIILGDCGVLFYNDPRNYQPYIDLYEDIGFTIIYVDGNHENFPLIDSFPEVTLFGAKANRIAEHLYRVRRGEVLEMEGHTFFCMGGATSIDKRYRIEGVSWWKEENISEEDMENGWRNLARYQNRVDFVLTHCVDSTSVFFALHMAPDRNTRRLEEIEAKVKYKAWLCGHYHVDRFLSSKKVVLYDRIGYLNEDSDILFDYCPDSDPEE